MDYRDRYFKVRNNDGDEIIIDRYMPKSYKKFARHFMNYCRLNRITYFKALLFLLRWKIITALTY